jgi:hypothetical protein
MEVCQPAHNEEQHAQESLFGKRLFLLGPLSLSPPTMLQ